MESKGSSSEVRAQYCWRGHSAANRKQTGPQQNLSTFRQQLSWENQGGDERKTPQSHSFNPVCCAHSPFCFSIAAGPDWLIASLIQFSRAFFKGLQVSLGFCTGGFLLLVPRFKLCKVIQRNCCDGSCRKDALHFKAKNSITNNIYSVVYTVESSFISVRRMFFVKCLPVSGCMIYPEGIPLRSLQLRCKLELRAIIYKELSLHCVNYSKND